MSNVYPSVDDLLPYVAYVVDDAGAGRKPGDDPHAIVREAGGQFKYASRLIAYQCGFEPLVVAVHSYLDVFIDDEEAEEMAGDYLEEIGWFNYKHSPRRDADYIV